MLRWLTAAMGPLTLPLACTLYDESLLDTASVLGGGSGVGSAASSSRGGQPASGVGGGSSGGAVIGGGVSDEGGSIAGTAAGGSSGNAGGVGVGGVGVGGGTSVDDGELVDDMEDSEGQITVTGGRDGFWYVGNDGTAGGMQTPIAGAFTMFELADGERPGSAVSAHMSVAGFTDWGSVIGFNFTELRAKVFAYDASAFCGIRFWARALAITAIRLRLADGDTHPAGQTCVESGPVDQLCYDHFGTSVTFSTAWEQHSVLFSALKQTGEGYHPADMKLKPQSLFSVEWSVGKGSPAGKPAEIWIDDVELLKPPAAETCK